MASCLISNPYNPLIKTIPFPTPKSSTRKSDRFVSIKPIISSSLSQPPKSVDSTRNPSRTDLTHGGFINAIINSPKIGFPFRDTRRRREVQDNEAEEEEEEAGKNKGWGEVGRKQMLVLCGFGYWVQGFRCFPWLALNFHMAHNLHFHPSILQLVQNSGNLPMVAKPLYGILSDAVCIGGARRITYISIGVVLQVLSWASLALIPFAGKSLGTLMSCVLLSNLGAALTEVAQDALVAEYGQRNKILGLQSYTFMAIAVAGILGNSLGGIILSRAHPKVVFLVFTGLLLLQLSISSTAKEELIGLSSRGSAYQTEDLSVTGSVKNQISDLIAALRDKKIAGPLLWVVASIATVPILSGSIFCYQTQYLNLDPSIIGMSRVVSQVALLSLTVLYDKFWKNLPLRNLVSTVQITYAFSLLLDLVLVRQINLKFGISNQLFALCFAGLSETIAIFKTVPFFVLIASLCPPGCEASLTSFLASTLCLASIVSGFLGIGVASVAGVSSGNYENLPVGILVQFVAALAPVMWIGNLLPGGSHQTAGDKDSKMGSSRSKRSRRNRRIGRVVLNSFFVYRRERGFQM